MSRALALVVAGALVGGALAGCEETAEPVPQPVKTIAGEPPPVVLVGCAFRTEAACEVTSATTLTLWIETAPLPMIDAWLDDDPIDVSVRDFPDGRRLRVELPPTFDGQSTLRLAFRTGRASSSWERVVRHVSLPDAWDRARSSRAEGNLDATIAALDELPSDAVWQARADGLRARVALMKGDTEGAIEKLTRSVRRHRVHGQRSDEASDALALTHQLIDTGRLAEAALVLEASRDAFRDGVAKVWEPYYRAMLAEAREVARRRLRCRRGQRSR